jgi:hypothetical protein
LEIDPKCSVKHLGIHSESVESHPQIPQIKETSTPNFSRVVSRWCWGSFVLDLKDYAAEAGKNE